MPAEAGIQALAPAATDSRLHGNDGLEALVMPAEAGIQGVCAVAVA